MTCVTGSCELYGLRARASYTFPLGFSTGTVGPASPQGVLHFRTYGTCSSERRVGGIVCLVPGKVNRNMKSPGGRGFLGLAFSSS